MPTGDLKMPNASTPAVETTFNASSECVLADNSFGLPLLSRLFYFFKPIMPRRSQLWLRRQLALRKLKRIGHVWPIDEAAGGRIGWPDGLQWPGWPHGKQFALVLNHDVDTQIGHDKCRQLMDLEETMGFRSTFYFVPERYSISQALLEEVKARGFGLGVHGLKHDGKLFSSVEVFCESAQRINMYLKQWGTRGFSAPSMIRNHAWMHQLDMDYCTSTFDTDPFEPQSDGIGTIFPFIVANGAPYPAGRDGQAVATRQRTSGTGPANSGSRHQQPDFFIELPYTLAQDHCLFVMLQEKDISIWKKKLDWIAAKGGMVLLNSHPDYMRFESTGCTLEEYDHQK